MMTNNVNPPEGNDLYCKIKRPNARAFSVTYWDVWISILLSTQFDGDWEAALAHFREQAASSSWQRDHVEGLVNHILHLRQALERAGLILDDLLKDADANFLKKQKPKAKRKLLEFSFRDYEKSVWMIETPRKQREFRALRGYWDQFPVSPLIFASDLSAIFKTGKYHLEDETFKLERKLSAFLDKKEDRLDIPGQLGLYRAFLTVVLENINEVDDSYGVIGGLYESVFETYTQLDRAQINLPLETYFQDFLELLTWEDYGFTFNSMPDFFARLSKSEVPFVEVVLRQQWQELDHLGLNYQSQTALTMLGLLYAQQAMFDQFVPIASIMGTNEWKRITILAGVAEKRKKYDLALGVYEACFRSGRQEDYLRKEYEKLKERIQKLPKKSQRPRRATTIVDDKNEAKK